MTARPPGSLWSRIWGRPYNAAAGNGCQISVINYSRKIDGKDALICASPLDNRQRGSIRVGLISEDVGKPENSAERYTVDWKYQYQVNEAGQKNGYSCLTELPDGGAGEIIRYEEFAMADLAPGAEISELETPPAPEPPVVPSEPSDSDIMVKTEKNEDGSVTRTETNQKTGAVTQTTVHPDGKRVVVATEASGDRSIMVVNAAGELPAPEKGFSDVPEGHWSGAAVNFVTGLGLFRSVGGDEYMTRGMLAIVLHRLSGRPSGGENSFKDMPDGTYYTGAVSWAAGNGVVTGVSGSIFNPDGNMTRETLALMLCRYSNLLGVDTAPTDRIPDSFADAGSVSTWAESAMA